MPRKRNSINRPLPNRWRYKHGAYYYRVPKSDSGMWDHKTEFRLGKTLNEAYKVWSARLQASTDISTLGQLLDRYLSEVVPLKAYKSQESNRISIGRIRSSFGHMGVVDFLPKDAYAYRHHVTQKHGPTSANRDLEVLSHLFSKAVEWGVIDSNPIKGQVRKNTIPRRERYIEDWELVEALSVAAPFLKAYIKLKLLTGLRRGDLLRLSTKDVKPDGIHVTTSKTKKKVVILWTSELSSKYQEVLHSRQYHNTELLFPTREGNCYVNEHGQANGFDSMWQRFMKKVLSSTKVEEKFQEKDLRKKTASDMSLQSGSRLLGHTSELTTQTHYRLNADLVAPHSLHGYGLDDESPAVVASPDVKSAE